ncbi:MAG: hypothetical protein JNK85_22775 [Verrucomicrobiales bacterium]|nr:hypothetical protein [Verrucomicrobiales bacterium]
MTRNVQRRSLYLLFLVSGAPGLVAQLTWGRVFAAGLGHEVPALIGVVTAFFLGLAAGAWWLQSTVARSRRPLLWYAVLELVSALWVGASALFLPEFCGQMLHWMGLQPGLLRQGSVCVLAPLVALSPATIAMGATLPAIDAAVRQRSVEVRRTGWLYGLNTLGAMSGTLLAVGLLMPNLGFRATLWLAASMQGGCALLAGALAWVDCRDEAATPERTAPAETGMRRGRGGVAWWSAVSGCLGLGFEWLALRGLAHATENTIQTYACGLSVLLGGMGLGAAVQRWARSRRTPWRVGQAAIGVVVAMLVAVALMSAVPRASWKPEEWLGGWGGEMALIALVFGFPSIPMGALYACLLDEVGDEQGGVGWVVGWNAAGAALAGPLVMGVILPTVGLKWTLGLVVMGYGLAFPLAGWRWRVGAVLGAATVLGLLPTPIQALEIPGGASVSRWLDGRLASVAVIRTADGHRALRVNNHFQQGGTATASAARRHVHLPLLLHPAPRRALVLGIGTGVSMGAATAYPGLSTDGVELLPEVIAVLPEFEPENAGLRRRSEVRLMVADARRFARVSPEHYDVIIADLFHPSEDGAGFLYTREHFAALRSRLATGGLLCQWLPLHQMDGDTFRCVVRTFVEVFPEASLWMLRFNADLPVLGLVGGRSEETMVLDPEELGLRLETPGMREALGPVALNTVSRVLGCRVAGRDAVRALAAGGELATDDLPGVLFKAARAVYRRGEPPGERLVRLLREVNPEFSEILPGNRRDAWVPRLEAFRTARDRHLQGLVLESAQQRDAAMDAYVSSTAASPDYTAGYAQAVMVAAAYAREDPVWARQALERLIKARPGERLAAEVLGRIPGAQLAP